MPSFDIVSQVDLHEVANALDQANREVGNRFDFKGVDASFEMAGKDLIQLRAEAEFQLRQMLDILRGKLVKRGVDTRSFAEGDVEISGRTATLPLSVRQGIESDVARELVRLVKTAKLKVQTSIQGDQLRVAGKKRDDLQNVIALVKEAKPDLPLQYVNFRD
ncbi:MAG: YajQ family cyclic di-GMP-binding protein [Gammaproteobacteria bacterium]|nr:YajQ family cyclic di-GMP-binding protein [Gammaproteobacteria bacterium]MCY4181744.1 YajQ family cyclic di-GMP-binding protein [Gammaproteobacteria bacterium]